MKLDEKSRDMLYSIENNGGSANTTEIRRETGLKNSAVRYRYDKLEERGLISTHIDESATPEGVAGVNVAELTEEGYEAISKGITAEPAQERAEVEPSDNYSEIKELRDRVHSLEQDLRDAERKAEFNRACAVVSQTYLAELDETPPQDEFKREVKDEADL